MEQNDLFMDSSILYRSTQKFFDKKLQPFQLTYAQLPVLIMVYENEGVSMQEIATQGLYDKGTITKNVQKLESLHYLHVISSNKDKRSKELYTTLKAKEIMSHVYEIRRDWWKQLNAEMTKEDIEQFSQYFMQVCEKSKKLMDFSQESVKFYRHQKVNLNMFPNHISTVFYTGGCNFQCKHCPNPDLVFIKQNMREIPMEDIETFLTKRKKNIQAICISGGEPCIHDNLSSFLSYGKQLGYKMCIRTNGSYPYTLIDWIEEGLLDYVILDIKQSHTCYSDIIGMEDYDVSNINQTIHYLQTNHFPYSYQLTLSKEFHNEKRVKEIGKWLQSDTEMKLSSIDFNQEEFTKLCDILKQYLPNLKIQGDTL